MRVEADCYIVKRVKGETLVKSHSVPPGGWEKVEFLGEKVKIALFCSLNRDRGSVLIKDPKRRTQVHRYENDEDEEGERVSTDSPIDIQGEQTVSIVTKKGKPEKEIVVFLSTEDDQGQEDSPLDHPEETPLDFGSKPKTPVGVS